MISMNEKNTQRLNGVDHGSLLPVVGNDSRPIRQLVKGKGCSEETGRERLGYSARLRQTQTLLAGGQDGTGSESIEIRSNRRRKVYR